MGKSVRTAILAITLATVAWVSSSAGLAAPPPANAAASASCIPIATPADLQAIRKKLDGRYCMANDLDLNGVRILPIGDAKHPFTGTFDGREHTITDFGVAATVPDVGLFGVIGIDDI